MAVKQASQNTKQTTQQNAAKSTGLIEAYERAVETLSPEEIYREIYDADPGNFKKESNGKCRAVPRWRETKSKNSFTVFEDKGFWEPGFNFAGFPADFIHSMKVGRYEKAKGKDFVDAVKDLCDRAGIQFPDKQPSEAELKRREEKEKRIALLRELYDYAQKQLWSAQGETAVRYLTEERGFSHNEIDSLGIGFFDSHANFKNYLIKKGYNKNDIKHLGISQKWNGYIIYPWHDNRNSPLTAYGRYQAKQHPNDGPKTLALPGKGTKRSPLYMDRALAEGHKELIYVEGVNDAAILQARGMTNVVASVSAGFDKNQIETLKRHGIESVILLNDADDGGCKGTFNNIRNLTNAGIDAYAPQDGLPENVDPDEYINQYGVEALKTLLSDPQHGIKWVVSRICSGYNTSSDKEARKAYNEVCRWIKNNISQYKMDAYLRKILNEALYIELGAIDTDSQSESWEDRPLPDSFSQGAIANWLEEQYRPSLAWDIEIKEWRRYGSKNPGVWTIEPVEFVRQVIQSQLDAIAPEFADDKGNLPDYTKNFIDGVENLMRSKLAVRHWDVQDRNLLPLKNGVLHLQTLEFREHAPGYRLTWALPYNYDPSADCEPIKEWLHYMCQGDESLVELIRAFLYGVVAGRVDWQKYLELIGPGGTGKSTVIRLATALVGLENTHTTTLRKLETSQFETANLKDKRLTVITDSERYTGPVNVLKALTGQDSIPYEQKYKQATSGFVPQSLVIVAANEQIQSADYTSGLERRRITVPFNKTIPSREQRDLIEFNADGGVYGEFADVIPGLLNWVLAINPEKSTRFVKDHIKAVPSLGEMKAQSLVESNPIADWLDNAIVYRPEHKTQVGVAKKDKDLNSANQYLYTSQWLYANYCEYCANTQSKPIGIRRFTNLLLDLCQNQLKLDGVYRDRDRKGRYFVGLKIRTDEDNDSALITGTESSPDDGSVTDAVTGRDGCVTAKTPGCAKSDGCDGSFQKSFLASDDIKNKTSDPPMGEMIENDPSHPAQSITHGESDPSRYPSQPDTQPVTDESNSTQRPSTGDSDPSQNGDCGNSDCATESDYKELLFEEREAEETQPTTTHPPLEDYEIGQRVWFMNEKGQWRKGFIADSRWLHDGNFKNWQFRGWLCRESKWQMEGGVIIPYQQCIMPLVND